MYIKIILKGGHLNTIFIPIPLISLMECDGKYLVAAVSGTTAPVSDNLPTWGKVGTLLGNLA